MPFRRRFRRRTRERTEWIGAIQVTPLVVAVNTLSQTTLLNQAALEEWPGGRIDRILGQFFVSPSTAPAAATGYGVFVGLQLDDVQVARDPELSPEYRWLWWWSCFPQIGGTGASDQNVARWIGYFRVDLDRRIRRRFGDLSNFSLLVKNSTGSGAGIQYSYAFRILIAAGAK